MSYTNSIKTLACRIDVLGNINYTLGIPTSLEITAYTGYQVDSHTLMCYFSKKDPEGKLTHQINYASGEGCFKSTTVGKLIEELNLNNCPFCKHDLIQGHCINWDCRGIKESNNLAVLRALGVCNMKAVDHSYMKLDLCDLLRLKVKPEIHSEAEGFRWEIIKENIAAVSQLSVPQVLFTLKEILGLDDDAYVDIMTHVKDKETLKALPGEFFEGEINPLGVSTDYVKLCTYLDSPLSDWVDIVLK